MKDSLNNKKSFEAAIQRLEEIISLLEEGKLPLEETLKLYEEAVLLYKDCNTELEQAEQKINMIVKAENGEFIIKDIAEQKGE